MISVLLAGCDSAGDSSSGDALPIGQGQPQPNPAMKVDLDSAAAGISGLSEFEVVAYDVRGAELGRQTVTAAEDANFEDLPAGSVQIRAIGLDKSKTVVGFSDVSAAVPTDTRVAVPALTQTGTVPPPATPGGPFLAFTGLPASYGAGIAYSLEVSAFDAQGQLDKTANSKISLSSSGVSVSMPSGGVQLIQGRSSFPAITFHQGSNGTVTFSASAAGFGSVVSPTLPVRSN